ncbi:MAG: hypothetical protein IIY75_02625, partial [Erysipelotrichales bacterium]|nr:hypothetical protein [Erysipelotrichales bacterium]
CKGSSIFGSSILWPTREVEIVFYIILFAKLWAFFKTGNYSKGQLFPRIMLSYGMFRFVEEFFRVSFAWNKMPLTHIWCVISMILGWLILQKHYAYKPVLHASSRIMKRVLRTALAILLALQNLSMNTSLAQAKELPVTEQIVDVPVQEKAVIPDRPAATAEATWKIGSTSYSSLSAALSAASSGSVIVLAADGTLGAGTYTIPNGVKLLIPMDSSNTLGATDGYVATYSTPSDYRILTMDAGAKIIVANGGSLNVASKYSAQGQDNGYNGTPSGPHGKIIMNQGSNITIQSGGELLCFGFISGPNKTSGVNDGTVTVQSGGIVRELFQIRDFRGGTATSAMNNNSNKVFPFSQYFVQNVEVPITFNSGSTDYVYSCVTMSSSQFPMADIKFVTNSGGLFN